LKPTKFFVYFSSSQRWKCEIKKWKIFVYKIWGVGTCVGINHVTRKPTSNAIHLL